MLSTEKTYPHNWKRMFWMPQIVDNILIKLTEY